MQFLVNGAAYGSTVPLSGGTAQLAITEPAGSYTVAAQYTGDANYAATLPAAETSANLTVSQVATATAVTPGTATVSFGQSATFTATVSSANGAPPDGSVQFLVNGAAYGSTVPLSGGTTQLAITEPAGSYTVAAQYTGDANYAATLPAAQTSATLTVNQAATATTVTPGTASVGFGQSATFTATVSSANGAPPDGSVQFLVNGAAYGITVPLSGGTAQLAITEPAGSYTVTAQYTGDANYAATLSAAETSASLTVNPAATATAVTLGAASVSFGQSATFTATVSSANGAPPDGSVQFLVNGVAYGSTVPLSGGTAQLAIAEPAGSYTVAAQYTGDANYAATLPAAETSASLTVNQAATATAITPGTASVAFGQSATFTATVSSANGAPPDGSVQFLVNGAAYGSTVTLSGGTAQLAIAEPAGSYTVAAQYTGDVNYAATLPAAETSASLTVNQAATATAVTPGTVSVAFGQSATFTATVSSANGAPPDGSVQFLVNGVAYGSTVPLSGGTAQLAITEPAGSYTVAAQYTGDANYAATLPAAETSASLTVNQAATATAVTPGRATVTFGQSATFTATVSSANGAPPDGSVQFLVNGVAYGSTVPLSGGTAQLAITEPAGSYTVTAQYTGDANYAATLPAAETSATLTVNQAAPTSVYVFSGYASDAPGTAVTWSDGSTHYVGFDAFGTIQAGINAVAAGGTVNVASGTYTEQLTIDQSLSVVGAGVSSTTIQAPATLSGNEIEIAGGVTVTMSGLNLDGASSSTAIDVHGGILSASSLAVTGYNVGVSVENGGAVKITASTIDGSATGILVGSGSGDTSTLTATNDSFAGDTVGVKSNQSSGSLTATMDWWGSSTGPTNTSNPGGTGAKVIGSVNFSPWLGDTNIVAPDYLVFLSTTGEAFVVTPSSGNTSLGVSLSGNPTGSIPGGGTLSFAGTGGTVTINGESGPASTDVFTIKDTSVQFSAADALGGTTIDFLGTGMTRYVDAQGTTNTFNIQGAGASGPSGSLVGDTGTNAFVFSGSSKLIGNIQGGGSSTLSYAAYSSGVNVNLGNGTNGTATGVSGTVTGITALIGGNSNDTLNAGTVPNVALTGGLGTNSLSGTGAGDSVVEAIASSYTLTNSKLTGRGAAFTDNLSGITVASLTGVSAISNTFTVSGWTGTGTLSAPAGTGTVTASKSAGYTLTNTALSSTDGMTLGLSGITTANLTDTGSGHTFTISGWTGSGTLKGSTETLLDVVSSSVVLAKTSLAVTGLPAVTLSGFTTANLTDTAGGNTFTVSGWTGSGSLTDRAAAGDTVTASKSAGYTLANTSLSSTDGMSLGLSGITTANLAATTASKTFTVSGWTGSGSLTDTATGIVTASENGGFTLTNTSLSSTDGMTLSLSGITTANLTDSGSGGNTFTITGWTGKGTLTGTPDTLVDTVTANATLTNASLAVTGLPTLTLSGFTTASLTDTAGGNTFTVSGWKGGGSLTDSAAVGDTVTASKSAGFTLANTSLSSTDGMSLGLSNVTTANLTDSGSGGNTFTITGWTGTGTLKGTAGTLVDGVSSSVVLAKTSLAVTGGPTLTLSGFTTANLTDTTGGNTFTVSGWTGSGSLTDSAAAGDTVTASKSASYTLANTSLSSTDGMSLGLSGITTANLAATSASKTFTVSGWTGSGSLTDTASGIVTASKNAGYTLTNTSLSSTDGMILGLSGITTANLTATATSGTPSYIVDASAFTGVTNLTAGGTVNAILFGGSANGSTLSTTGSGNDVLIGGSGKDTLTDTGTGYNILIGGPGVDTLTGNGNDILISGTTSYDSNTSANIAALDAILAEWSSSDSYSLRISKIMNGLGTGGTDALNSSTCQSDGVANTVSDGASTTQNNWFIVNSKDKVTKKSNETETIV